MYLFQSMRLDPAYRYSSLFCSTLSARRTSSAVLFDSSHAEQTRCLKVLGYIRSFPAAVVVLSTSHLDSSVEGEPPVMPTNRFVYESFWQPYLHSTATECPKYYFRVAVLSKTSVSFSSSPQRSRLLAQQVVIRAGEWHECQGNCFRGCRGTRTEYCPGSMTEYCPEEHDWILPRLLFDKERD